MPQRTVTRRASLRGIAWPLGRRRMSSSINTGSLSRSPGPQLGSRLLPLSLAEDRYEHANWALADNPVAGGLAIGKTGAVSQRLAHSRFHRLTGKGQRDIQRNVGAQGGNRTRTPVAGKRILSPRIPRHWK